MTEQSTLELAPLVTACTQEYATSGLYTGMNITIDLTTQQGRWELVVLALLLAARISESVVERTFQLLRESGLLEYERVLIQRLTDVTQTQEILQAEYRALINRNRKVMAIYSNAKWLADYYDGDIQRIYDSCYPEEDVDDPTMATEEAAADAASELIRRLRKLQQIDSRARWISRVMLEAELWPQVPVAATVYFDRHVRCVLQRLGVIATGQLQDQLHAAEEAIEALFNNDTIGLSRLGKYVCQKHDPVLCAQKCCLYEYCSYRQKTECRDDGEY